MALWQLVVTIICLNNFMATITYIKCIIYEANK